jgi:hypothetical protein
LLLSNVFREWVPPPPLLLLPVKEEEKCTVDRGLTDPIAAVGARNTALGDENKAFWCCAESAMDGYGLRSAVANYLSFADTSKTRSSSIKR